MLKYHTFEISCREVPEEVSICFNITGCQIKCPGCNNKTLWKDKGTLLTIQELRSILKNYNSAITCVCFMGGEHEPAEINMLARLVKHNYPCLHTAWYCGLNRIPKAIEYRNFDYIKIGDYQASKGDLSNPDTNQIMYRIEPNGKKTNITSRFIRTEPDEVVKRDETSATTIEEPETPEITEETPIELTENEEITQETTEIPTTDVVEDYATTEADKDNEAIAPQQASQIMEI